VSVRLRFQFLGSGVSEVMCVDMVPSEGMALIIAQGILAVKNCFVRYSV
jgi:hypothetical protein